MSTQSVTILPSGGGPPRDVLAVVIGGWPLTVRPDAGVSIGDTLQWYVAQNLVRATVTDMVQWPDHVDIKLQIEPMIWPTE